MEKPTYSILDLHVECDLALEVGPERDEESRLEAEEISELRRLSEELNCPELTSFSAV